MSDYRWYQDIFLSRVMLRKDCYKPYWKEKFNDGLPPIFAHKKNVSKKYVKQNPTKGKCFNCGKPGHYIKDCKKKPDKLKNKLNMLNINDEDQEDLFRILESNNSSDSLEDNLSS
ncbi:hypothetical protein SO802_019418 [Lithocarpus litseifolius]|uniref:CCHC-type domain-containing protein n=1 Tax=Lithocarpus litseifolius TaxID=425828 RepID=A0AAW2CNQ7_9ROSI